MTPWGVEPDPALVVQPGICRTAYQQQAARFDRVVSSMTSVWEAYA